MASAELQAARRVNGTADINAGSISEWGHITSIPAVGVEREGTAPVYDRLQPDRMSRVREVVRQHQRYAHACQSRLSSLVDRDFRARDPVPPTRSSPARRAR